MRMNKKQIGENAGIVWRALHSNKHSWEELVKATGAEPFEIGRRHRLAGKGRQNPLLAGTGHHLLRVS